MANNSKTPVMVLHELAVKQSIAPPKYEIVSQRSGTHENRFDVLVSIAEIQANGNGLSKKIAKHQAAYNALMKLKEMGMYNPSVNPVSEVAPPSEHQESPYNAVLSSVLNLENLCMKKKIPLPKYCELLSVGPPHAKEFTYECKILSLRTEAKGSSKRKAKQLAAKIMLQKIDNVLPDLIAENAEALAKVKVASNENVPNTKVAKVMNLLNLTYEDFVDDLKDRTEESLKRILNRLKMPYEIRPHTTDSSMALLTLEITDTPCVLLGTGSTYEEAVGEAVRQAFTVLDCYMKY